jgi:hypothetical protein
MSRAWPASVTFSHVMLLLSVVGVTRQYCVFSYVLPYRLLLLFSIVVIEAVLPWFSQTVEPCTRDSKRLSKSARAFLMEKMLRLKTLPNEARSIMS